MWVAIVIVLAGVYFTATGRGGELAYEHADHAPLDLGPVSAADVALLRPPTALWGYNVQVTDEALDRIARAIRDRDLTIARLQQRLAAFEPGSAPGLPGWPAPSGAATREDRAWHDPGWYEAPSRTAEWPGAAEHPGPGVPGPEIHRPVAPGPEAASPEAASLEVPGSAVPGPEAASPEAASLEVPGSEAPDPGASGSEASGSAADRAAASPGDAGPPDPSAPRDGDALGAEEQSR
jgi:hypothetical protein